MHRFKMYYVDDNLNNQYKVIKALDIDDAIRIAFNDCRLSYSVLVDVIRIKE